MDTIQTFIPTVAGGATIDDFIVTGYSKRGWTTWLTAAADDRVRAMIPGVFDNPNQGPSMAHHVAVYGFFSEQVGDYSEMQIFERLKTPEAALLSRIVDPYRYLNNGRFEIPKLVLNSAGDEFFVSDSSQYYFEDLPGDTNYMRYFPNTGHGLDAGAGASTITFMDAILNNRPLPEFSWIVQTDGTIHVQTVDAPSQVLLWKATNPNSRDFRHGYHPEIIWTSSPLADQGGGTYIGSVPVPDSGATAFFVELTFPSAIPGVPYVFTTDVEVSSVLPLFPWPYEDPSLDASGDGGLFFVEPDLLPPIETFIVAQLFMTTSPTDGWSEVQGLPPDVGSIVEEATALPTPAQAADSPAHAPDATDDAGAQHDSTAEAVDAVFDADLDHVLA
jgi:PhoPQ-activated pathogenicity-related protein